MKSGINPNLYSQYHALIQSFELVKTNLNCTYNSLDCDFYQGLFIDSKLIQHFTQYINTAKDNGINVALLISALNTLTSLCQPLPKNIEALDVYIQSNVIKLVSDFHYLKVQNNTIHNAINNLINNHKQLITDQQTQSVPSDYAKLQAAAVLKELSEEVEKLSQLFSIENATVELLKNSFKQLCEQRDLRNQSSCLSYTAIPEGICNRLYFDITIILFQPSSFYELIAVLMPSIKECLIIELSDDLLPKMNSLSRNLEQRVQLKLVRKPLSMLTTFSASLSTFAQTITSDDILFILEPMEKLPLSLHLKLYKQLDVYPLIKEKLYQHNNDFKQLKLDIQLTEKNGVIPYEMLTNFSNELIMSGSRYTGNHHAKDSAAFSCLHFRAYLDHLAPEFSEELLALKTSNSGSSLRTVLEDLSKGSCVETAASHIKQIQANQNNIAILKKPPYSTEKHLNKVKNRYRKAIDLTGYDTTKTLPLSLMRILLNKIKITSANDYIDLLINLPSTEYLTFLTHADITCNPTLPNGLNIVFTMLSSEQLNAFITAILYLNKKFNGINAILSFIGNDKNNVPIFMEQLKQMPVFIITKVLKQKNSYGFPKLLDFALQQNENNSFDIIWNLLPKDKRLKLLPEKNSKGDTILHMAVSTNSTRAFTVLESYAPEDKFIALVEKNHNDGITPMHFAVQNSDPNLFFSLWKILPVEFQDAALNLSSYQGSGLLEFASQKSHPTVWKFIWNIYSDDQRWTAINKKDKSLLYWAIKYENQTALNDILLFLYQKNQLTLLWEKANIKDSNIHSLTAIQYAANEHGQMFHLIFEFLHKKLPSSISNNPISLPCFLEKTLKANDITLFRSIWNELSYQDKLSKLYKNINDYYTLFLFSITHTNPNYFITIWNSLLKEDQLAATTNKMTYQCHDGLSLFHVAAGQNSPIILQTILHDLADEIDLTEIMDSNGKTPLCYAAANDRYDAFLLILNHLNKKNQLIKLLNKYLNNFNQNPLYYAIKKFTAPRFKIIWDSLPDDAKEIIKSSKTEHGNNLLSLSISFYNIEKWKIIWEFYSDEEKINVIKKESLNADGDTYLHLLPGLCDSNVLKTVLEFIPLDYRLSAILKPNKSRNTPFLKALKSPNNKLAHIMWELLPVQDKLLAIKQNGRKTLLNLTLDWNNTDNFFLIWNSLTADEQSILTQETNYIQDLVYKAVYKNNPQIFHALWKYIPEENKLHFIQNQENQYENGKLLYFSCQVDSIFSTIWNCIPKKYQLQELQKFYSDRTLFDCIVGKNSEILFQTVWNSLTTEEKLILLEQEYPQTKDTPLHFHTCSSNRDRLRIILNFLAEQGKLAVIFKKNSKGKNVLHAAIHNYNPNAVLIMYEFIKKNQDFLRGMWQAKDNDDYTLYQLILYRNYSYLFHNAIFSLPHSDRSTILLEKNIAGDTSLHIAIRHYESYFRILWKSLSVKEKLIAANILSSNSYNLIIQATIKKDLKTWQEIWELYTHQEKLALIQNFSLLYHAAESDNRHVMRIILKFLPEDLRLSYLYETHTSGKTPINIAVSNDRGEILNIILLHLPEEDRLSISGSKAEKLHQPILFQSIFNMFYNHQYRIKELKPIKLLESTDSKEKVELTQSVNTNNNTEVSSERRNSAHFS